MKSPATKFIEYFHSQEENILANRILGISVSWNRRLLRLEASRKRLIATGILLLVFLIVEMLLLLITRIPIKDSLRSSLLAASASSIALYVVSWGYSYIQTRLEKSAILPHIGKNIDKLLVNWLQEVASLRKQVITSLILTVLAIATAYILSSLGQIPLNQNIPTYFALGLITFCMSQGAYWNAVIPLLTRRLRQVDISEFDIYTLNPSISPLIYSMSRVYSVFVIVDALVVTACLAGLFYLYPTFNSSRSLYYVSLILLGYALTCYTFFYPQWNLAQIIQEAKDATMRQLQQRIGVQYESILNGEKTDYEHFKHLLELHEKISSTPNSAIRWSGVQSFIGSLALPTMVAIIGALDWTAILNRLTAFF